MKKIVIEDFYLFKYWCDTEKLKHETVRNIMIRIQFIT